MTRWKSTLAERVEAREAHESRRALLESYARDHQCTKNPSMCAICAPAEAARWAARVARYEPRPKSRMQFSVDSFRRSLSF